jgi:hypothetical protein
VAGRSAEPAPPPAEAPAERLLESETHEARAGAGREVLRESARRLLAFLDRHTAEAPSTLLRYAIEHLDPELRAHYRRLGTTGG